jgi:hydrogenase maturation protease
MNEKKVLVIGFGSVLRGDDSFGPIVAEEIEKYLSNQGTPSSQVEVLIKQTLTPELAEDVSKSELVIFIDASKDGEPGTLIEERIQSDPLARVSMVHFLNPKALLNWTEQLYGKQVEAVILTVVGNDFNFGINKLTQDLINLRPLAVARAKEIIQEHLSH